VTKQGQKLFKHKDSHGEELIMLKLEMKHLEECFNKALESGELYVAVAVETDGLSNLQTIINPLDNAKGMLEYYKKSYGNDLTHKFSRGIRIVACTYGNSFAEIESNLMETFDI
jgi:hypothetical protein